MNGLDWCWLLVDQTCGFYQLFGLSFWRHPFTADDPLVRKWCNARFLQICSHEEINSSTSWMAWEYIFRYFKISFFCLRRLTIHMVGRQGKWEALLLGRLRTRCAEMCLWHWTQLHRSQILLQLWCRSETMVRSYSLLFCWRNLVGLTRWMAFCRRQREKPAVHSPGGLIVILDALIIQGLLELHTTILCFFSIIYYHSKV